MRYRLVSMQEVPLERKLRVRKEASRLARELGLERSPAIRWFKVCTERDEILSLELYDYSSSHTDSGCELLGRYHLKKKDILLRSDIPLDQCLSVLAHEMKHAEQGVRYREEYGKLGGAPLHDIPLLELDAGMFQLQQLLRSRS